MTYCVLSKNYGAKSKSTQYFLRSLRASRTLHQLALNFSQLLMILKTVWGAWILVFVFFFFLLHYSQQNKTKDTSISWQCACSAHFCMMTSIGKAQDIINQQIRTPKQISITAKTSKYMYIQNAGKSKKKAQKRLNARLAGRRYKKQLQQRRKAGSRKFNNNNSKRSQQLHMLLICCFSYCLVFGEK